MNLPITVTARIADSVQLTYRTPADSVAGLLPDGLELVRRGPWAFWNVMACRVERARPQGVPAVCGVSYQHVGYRLLVQAMTDRAEVVRGVYYTHSDVSARAVSAIGNLLTGLDLTPATIDYEASDCGVRVTTGDSGQGSQAPGGSLALRIDAAHAPARLAEGSCFPTTEDARLFCRHTPEVLSVDEDRGRHRLRITRAHRGGQPWCETPLVLHDAELGYFASIGQQDKAELEWACRLGPMDWRWVAGESAVLLIQPRVQQPVALAVGQGA